MRARARVVAVLCTMGLFSGCGGGSGDPPPPVDTTPPAVAEASLADGAVGVRTDAVVWIEFSEPMDVASVEAALSVTGPSGPVPGTLSWDAAHRRVSFRPAAPYPPSTHFTVALGAGARDAAGNALGAAWQAGFTTGGVPEVASTTPPAGATGVAVGLLVVRIEFATPMDGDTLAGAFALADAGGHAVAGTVTYVLEDGVVPVLRFALAGALAPRTAYTATLSTAARGAGGTPLSTPFSFSFTTGAGPQAFLAVGNSPAIHWLNMFGRVVDDHGRIDCGGTATTCSAEYDVGTVVTLTAQPAPVGVLNGWLGDDCGGLTGTSVTLTMDVGRRCTADFTYDPADVTLNVTLGSGWIGRVRSVPPAFGIPPRIDCGALADPSVCSAGFSPGIPVDLVAYPAANAPAGTFRWTCTGDDLANPGGTNVTDGNGARVWMTRPKDCDVGFVPAPP